MGLLAFIAYVVMAMLTATGLYVYDSIKRSRKSAQAELPLSILGGFGWPVVIPMVFAWWGCKILGDRVVTSIEKRSKG